MQQTSLPESDRLPPRQLCLPFEEWRDRFLRDAEFHGVRPHAERIADGALRLFWREGLDPTVQAMLESA